MRAGTKRDRIEKLLRSVKFVYYRFLRHHASPEEMARGVGLGLFISLTPTSPFQMVIAIFLASIFKGNQLIAALMTWLTNPLTSPFLYAGTYWVGRIFLHAPPLKELFGEELSLIELLKLIPKLGWRVFISLFIGGLIAGGVIGIIGYYFTAPLSRILKERRQQRIRRRILRAQPPPELPSA